MHGRSRSGALAWAVCTRITRGRPSSPAAWPWVLPHTSWNLRPSDPGRSTRGAIRTSAYAAQTRQLAGEEIRPFRIDIPQTAIDDLNNGWRNPLAERAAWHWLEPRRARRLPEGIGGVLAHRLRLAGARGAAQRPSRSSRPTIDGQTIHFLHVQSPEPNATPVDAHPWLAGLVRRVHRADRTADRPRGARWRSRRCLSCRHSVGSRFRVFDAAQ